MANPTISELSSRIQALDREVALLKEGQPSSPALARVRLRDVPREEAREEILKAFRTGRTLYYSDIVADLKLDIDLVIDVCSELEAEGRIETLGDDELRWRSPGRRTAIRGGAKDRKTRTGQPHRAS